MDLGLAGKVAIVTGASDGIGKAAAMRFAKEGASVAILARTMSDWKQSRQRSVVQPETR